MCFYSFIFFLLEPKSKTYESNQLQCWIVGAARRLAVAILFLLYNLHSRSWHSSGFPIPNPISIPHPEIPSAASACSTKHSLILSPFQGRHPLSNPSWQYQLGYHRRCILKNYSFSHSFMSVFCLKYRCTTRLT